MSSSNSYIPTVVSRLYHTRYRGQRVRGAVWRTTDVAYQDRFGRAAGGRRDLGAVSGGGAGPALKESGMSDLHDPRVLFAAERTLLAWTRTCLTLIGFGFLIERFRLFERFVVHQPGTLMSETLSYWTGLAFIVLGAFFALTSVVQFRRALRDLKPAEIPRGYWVNQATALNIALAIASVALVAMIGISEMRPS